MGFRAGFLVSRKLILLRKLVFRDFSTSTKKMGSVLTRFFCDGDSARIPIIHRINLMKVHYKKKELIFAFYINSYIKILYSDTCALFVHGERGEILPAQSRCL